MRTQHECWLHLSSIGQPTQPKTSDWSVLSRPTKITVQRDLGRRCATDEKGNTSIPDSSTWLHAHKPPPAEPLRFLTSGKPGYTGGGVHQSNPHSHLGQGVMANLLWEDLFSVLGTVSYNSVCHPLLILSCHLSFVELLREAARSGDEAPRQARLPVRRAWSSALDQFCTPRTSSFRVVSRRSSG